MLQKTLQISFAVASGSAQLALAQTDPAPRQLMQLAFYQPVTHRQPSSASTSYDSVSSEFQHTDAVSVPTLSPLRLNFSLHYSTFRAADKIEDHSKFLNGQAYGIPAAHLERLKQPHRWQILEGDLLSYTPGNKVPRVMLRYSAFHEQRDGYEGERSVGVLFQFDLGKRNHQK